MKYIFSLLIVALLVSCSPHTTVAKHKRYYKHKIEGPEFPTHESVVKNNRTQ